MNDLQHHKAQGPHLCLGIGGQLRRLWGCAVGVTVTLRILGNSSTLPRSSTQDKIGLVTSVLTEMSLTHLSAFMGGVETWEPLPGVRWCLEELSGDNHCRSDFCFLRNGVGLKLPLIKQTSLDL